MVAENVMSEKPVFNPVRLLIPLGILLVGVFAYFLMGRTDPNPKKVLGKEKLLHVAVQAAEPYDKLLILEVDGEVVPYREIQLATEVAGLIDKKSNRCRAGIFVKEKELLFNIDKRDFKFEESRWKKQVDQSEIELEEVELEIKTTADLLQLAEQDRELSEKERDRLKRLKDGQIITESDVDKAERAVLTSQNAVVQLSSQLATFIKRKARLVSGQELAAIELEQATLNVTRTEVVAPVSGVITRELVEEDSFVQKGAALVVIEDTSRAEVRCNLRMEELYWICSHEQQGLASLSAQTAKGLEPKPAELSQYQLPRVNVDVVYTISGQGDTEYIWKGHLERYDGSGIDPDTRMVPVRVVVEKPRRAGAIGPPRLLRGMYVTVRIKINPRLELIQVPEGAIQAGNRLWVVEPKGGSAQQASLKRIDEVSFIQRIGGVNGSTQEHWVLDGTGTDVRPGSLVVTRPLIGVKAGDLVTYKQLAKSRGAATGSADDGSRGASQSK